MGKPTTMPEPATYESQVFRGSGMTQAKIGGEKNLSALTRQAVVGAMSDTHRPVTLSRVHRPSQRQQAVRRDRKDIQKSTAAFADGGDALGVTGLSNCPMPRSNSTRPNSRGSRDGFEHAKRGGIFEAQPHSGHTESDIVASGEIGGLGVISGKQSPIVMDKRTSNRDRMVSYATQRQPLAHIPNAPKPARPTSGHSDSLLTKKTSELSSRRSLPPMDSRSLARAPSRESRRSAPPAPTGGASHTSKGEVEKKAAVDGEIEEVSEKVNSKCAVLNGEDTPVKTGPRPRYTFAVIGGNNSFLVSKALKTRSWWGAVKGNSERTVNFNLKWKPETRGMGFSGMGKNTSKLFNHFENNREIAMKTRFYSNLRDYYEKNRGVKIFHQVPVTYLVRSGQMDIEYTNMVQHFRFLASLGKLEEDMIDDSHTIWKSNGSLRSKFAKVGCENVQPRDCRKNIWIVKPSGLNRGKGIKVVKKLEDIESVVDSDKSCTWVIQKYIERPLLVRGRKFDIRCYVLVDSKLRIWFHKFGYLRTSQKEFKNADLDNEFVHLTNHWVQKHGKNYGEHEEGNQLGFDDFQQILDEEGRNVDFERDMRPRMMALVGDAFLSVVGKFEREERRGCSFELFGVDFMVDEDMNIFLIEVNANPCFELSSQVVKEGIPRVVEDCLKVAVDPLFPKAMRHRDKITKGHEFTRLGK